MLKKLSALLLFSLFAVPALADDTQAYDKSSYDLFNPVPEDQMRSFSTDRPTKSASPYTVDAGHFQYEADVVNATYDHYNSVKLSSLNVLVMDPTLKAGLTQNTDLEIAFAPLNFNQSHDRVTGINNTAAGFGDVYTRLKYNLLGNEGGDYALAIVPYVKAPTAAHNVGNNHVEGGGYIPFSVALPQDWTMSLTSELDILENANLNGMHSNYQNLINFGHPLFTDTVVGYVEFWSDVNTDHDAPSVQYTLDFAASWMVKDNIQLDAGVNIGLNKATSDLQPYLGVSQRF